MINKPKNTNLWIAVYIYHPPEKADVFLQEIIAPLTLQLTAQNLFDLFHFIRYQDVKGTHIRYRCRCTDETTFLACKKSMQHFLFETDQDFDFHTYEPEHIRYGGITGLMLMETIYHFSSKQVLSILSENKNWEYAHALSSALKLHQDLVFQLNFSKEEAAVFFQLLTDEWTKANIILSDSNLKNQDVSKYVKVYKNAFQEVFKKSDVQTSLQHQWENTDYFNGYNNGEMINACMTLESSVALLDNSAIKNYTWNNINDEETKLFWSLLADVLHFSNNRLGLQNWDEPLINYMIYSSLKT
ncbi:MAG: thiopeptide-type bacteriocin biosynthesis protein [Saprospiraceae bacterium]|nr:thiopeptide-type bacteriocin biosynthesis protein [Saprospiraceae bacterium]